MNIQQRRSSAKNSGDVRVRSRCCVVIHIYIYIYIYIYSGVEMILWHYTDISWSTDWLTRRDIFGFLRRRLRASGLSTAVGVQNTITDVVLKRHTSFADFRGWGTGQCPLQTWSPTSPSRMQEKLQAAGDLPWDSLGDFTALAQNL